MVAQVIDSGTTIMYGPPSDVAAVYASVPGASQLNSENGLYQFPCDHVPAVAFSWGGQNWNVSADKYVSAQ